METKQFIDIALEYLSHNIESSKKQELFTKLVALAQTGKIDYAQPILKTNPSPTILLYAVESFDLPLVKLIKTYDPDFDAHKLLGYYVRSDTFINSCNTYEDVGGPYTEEQVEILMLLDCKLPRGFKRYRFADMNVTTDMNTMM